MDRNRNESKANNGKAESDTPSSTPVGIFRGFRRFFSRTRLAARLIYASAQRNRKTDPPDAPGVVILQIDGLSFDQFKRALSEGRLPNLRGMMSGRTHSLKPLYSGVPSTTPAVLGELFFGVKSAVPAFEFIDRDTGRRHMMFSAATADKIDERIQSQGGKSVLKGGSVYGSIYTARAGKSRYCVQELKLEEVKRKNPFRTFLALLLYPDRFLRIFGFAATELVLAFFDFFRGVVLRHNIFKEFKFIPTRVFICIVLREMIRFHVMLDIERGIPAIYANFVGYDEQAHRRGPDSRFAHSTLNGIDSVLASIARAAAGAESRNYRLVVLSDHGQEAVYDYTTRQGRSVKRAIRTLWSTEAESGPEPEEAVSGRWFGQWKRFFLGQPVTRSTMSEENPDADHPVRITTTGPFGHVYPANPVADPAETAHLMVSEIGIPLVLYRANGRFIGVNRHGAFDLETRPESILGADHPHLTAVAKDITTVLQHPLAGDFIISGWDPDGDPYSFNVENGAHGGPGIRETEGFLLLPADLADERKTYRPRDVREIIRHIRKDSGGSPPPIRIAEPEEDPAVPAPSKENEALSLTVMTYNIHSCIGVDGRVDPDRIVRVIAENNPDVVGLQEVDAGRKRTRHLHQAAYFGVRLKMGFRFFPLMEIDRERYGLALLSRHPVTEVRQVTLPCFDASGRRERRGAMRARIETASGPLYIFNTHLSLYPRERRFQAADLVFGCGRRDLPAGAPVILLGDLNAGVRSLAYRTISSVYADARTGLPLKPTYNSRYPVLRLDHIFVSEHFRTEFHHVPDRSHVRIASDHLPVVARLRFTPPVTKSSRMHSYTGKIGMPTPAGYEGIAKTPPLMAANQTQCQQCENHEPHQ